MSESNNTSVKPWHHSVPVLRRGKSSFESYVPSIGWLYADNAVWGGELWSRELCWVFLRKNRLKEYISITRNISGQVLLTYACQAYYIPTVPDFPHKHTHGVVTKTVSISLPKVNIFKQMQQSVDNNVGGMEKETKNREKGLRLKAERILGLSFSP